MANLEVVKYFAEQIQWIFSAVEAILNRTPVPPIESPPGGQVGKLINSVKDLASQYEKLDQQVGEFSQKEKELLNTISSLQTELSLEKETAFNSSMLDDQLKRLERRVEELGSANQALKDHNQYLIDQLNISKEELSSKDQLEQRLNLREIEIKQLSEKSDVAESSAKGLQSEIAKISEQLRGEVHAFHAVKKIADLIGIALQPQEVLKRACQIPVEFIGFKRSATILKDEPSDGYIPIQSSGFNPSLAAIFKALRFREQEMPLITELMARKRPIFIEDCRKAGSKAKVFLANGTIESFETARPLLSNDFVERFDSYSVLAVPFISRGRPSGVILVDYGNMAHQFSETEVVAMDALGQLIGVALDNVHNYHDTSMRLLELERKQGTVAVLKEMEEAMFSTNQAEQIISTAISMMPRAIACEWVSVLLADRHANGFFVLGNLGNLIRGKGTIPFEHTIFDGLFRADQVLHRPNLHSESKLSFLDQHLVSHGIGSDLVFPLPVDGEIIGLLHLCNRRVAGFSQEDIIVGQQIAGKLAEALRRATAQRASDRREQDGTFEMVQSLIQSVSDKDSRLGDYRDQMIACGLEIAKGLELDEEQGQWIKYAIVLHDIGKSTLPSHILNKKDILTEKEVAVLRNHPIQGAEMIKNFRFTELIEGIKFVKFVVPFIRHSYERWDGTGFPDGMKGDAIPVGSRILAVVNAYSAMMTDRPYRQALPAEDAIREIQNASGTHFDPRVVELFLNYSKRQTS